ncbi:MAG: hypothetical protein JSS42_08640 [Proteobacteria bacterium]|uniref:hypothetical protein n=1 Tax=Rudaea sp. TaxID=2136325 RepID=UPI003220414C|nr:hypothetical protein [Pseudomonadota bacterium]
MFDDPGLAAALSVDCVPIGALRTVAWIEASTKNISGKLTCNYLRRRTARRAVDSERSFGSRTGCARTRHWNIDCDFTFTRLQGNVASSPIVRHGWRNPHRFM